MDEGEIVDAAGQMRKHCGHVRTGLSVLRELPWAAHYGAAFAEERGDGVGALGFLAVTFGERGLVVEGVDVADAAREEDKDGALGLRSEVRFGRRQLREPDPERAATDFPQPLSARDHCGLLRHIDKFIRVPQRAEVKREAVL